ncbi:MAG: AMP-binding protein [Gammaproteobacteria bacterium]|nr:AMP-binding protein [Gammaproteobacteria bacterium]
MQNNNLRALFEAIVELYAAETALHYETKTYSYEQLNDRADELAYWMQSNGLQQGDVVGILSSKIFEDYALMIACLKSGIAYTNIDVDNPLVRIKDICQTCQPGFLFGGEDHRRLSDELNIECVNYNDINSLGNPVYMEIDADLVAYIMFTSGSTGNPKGAAITHANLINFIRWGVSRYDITSRDNFANISPMYFDNSVFDFFTAFFSGASLTPIKKDLLNDPLALLNHIDTHKCSIWFSVPSMLIYLLSMRVLTQETLTSIRIFTFGGEGFPKTELRKLFDLYSHQAEFINVYGPTECTCICSSHTITISDFEKLDELPSLGTINDDFSFILDDGELCLIGPNVGKGYYNDKGLSENVFSVHDGQPMYRTGDLVEEINGLLYFKGRTDNQIKHMGYRIELEEIEIALNSLPQVRQAVVLYQRDNAAYGKIIAFILPDQQSTGLLAIKQALKLKLPAYMQPNKFNICEAFPKNANGKIDKKQLHARL